MDKIIPIIDARQQIKQKLEAAGYTGLYCDGECGCAIDDLMPCQEATVDPGEDFINGCDGGHTHNDPTNPAFFVISPRREAPGADEWERLRVRYGVAVKERANEPLA